MYHNDHFMDFSSSRSVRSWGKTKNYKKRRGQQQESWVPKKFENSSFQFKFINFVLLKNFITLEKTLRKKLWIQRCWRRFFFQIKKSKNDEFHEWWSLQVDLLQFFVYIFLGPVPRSPAKNKINKILKNFKFGKFILNSNF